MAKGVTVEFNANVARFTSSVDKMTNDLSKFQTNAQRIGKNVQTVFAGMVAGFSAGGLVAFTKTTLDSIDRLNDLSKTTSLTISQLSGLGVAAKMSATDLETVAASVSRLSVNMGKDAEKFRALGITAKDPLEAFQQLADVFVSIRDPQERAAVAAAALGKSWESVAPLLSEGGASIARMSAEGAKSLGITQEMADKAGEFNDQLDMMAIRFGAVSANIVGQFLPAMNGAIDRVQAISSAAAKGGLFGWLTSSGEEEASAAATIESLKNKVQSLKKLRDELSTPTLANKVNDVVFGDVKDLNIQIAATEKKIAYLQSLVKSTTHQIDNASTSKAPNQAAISAFLGSSNPSTKAAIDLAKKAALEREKIFQHEIEVELDAFNKFHKERERLAKESQQALDSLMQEGRSLQLSVDPMARMNAEMERYSELLKAGAINQQTFDLAVAKSTADLERATSGNVERLKTSVDSASEHMNAVLIGFQINVQRNLGDTLFRSLSGDFDNIGDAWKTMLFRMASDAAAANLSRVIFGEDGTGGSGLLGKGLSLLGSVLGLFGGGGAAAGTASYTGYGGLGAPRMFALGGIVDSPTPFKFAEGGAFRSGLMGEAGPEAIMPLKRDSQGRLGVAAQGRSGGGVVINQTINVDSRTDRAEVHAIVSRAVKSGNAELVDRLNRQGVI